MQRNEVPEIWDLIKNLKNSKKTDDIVFRFGVNLSFLKNPCKGKYYKNGRPFIFIIF